MHERELRELIERVRAGRLPRRSFVQRLALLGLAAPLAGQLLSHAGIAQSQSRSAYRPTKRGGGGTLRQLWWQAPTLLNPHFATGSKDVGAARLFYEPLATWDSDGNLLPILAAEIPSLDNGGVAGDGLSVTWKLRRGVTWHDGRPFTADDVVFNWEYARDPATATVSIGNFASLTMRRVDSHNLRVEFAAPTPFWADGYVTTPLIPRHVFAAYAGSRSRDAPANLRPVGTGPYRFVEFKPGDMVRGELNPDYHMPNRPHFDRVEMKGGGDAVSAARAVLQTGEYDYAWNTLVEDEVLRRLESGGRGRVVHTPGGDVEYIMCNFADPWSEVDGERSSPKSRHPVLTDPVVRQALALLVDRAAIEQHIFGRTGTATANFLNNPAPYNSPNRKSEFSVDKANALLDAAGFKRGPDGVRTRDGRKLKFVFQTSINAPRQKVQAVIKQAAQRAGIDIELKAITAAVFFSSDVANPDTNAKFIADLQMYNITRASPDPGRFMELFCSWELASKENKWQGRNFPRWRNEEYDRAFRAAAVELDPVKRATLFIRMNDLVCGDHAVIPLVSRRKVSAVANGLHAPMSGWANEMQLIHDWYRDT